MSSLETRQSPSVGDEGYGRIRADIIFGRLEPGQRLRLETLKQDYGLSIATLREILNRLTSDRLVLAEGKRGFEVAPVSIEDLQELGELRQLIESYAIDQSFARGDVEWEGRVVSAHHKLASTERLIASRPDVTELLKRYDGEFHQALISSCGSSAMMEMHADVFDRFVRYQIISADFSDQTPARQHAEMLECALTRDVERAKSLLAAHVADCIRHTATRWPRRAS
jgi:GntR family transcriptional regulator, carbon starvation induced regulator